MLVFRDGNEVRTVDNGNAAPLSSRMHFRDTIQYGPIKGIEEGQCYTRRALVETYGHRAERKAVNGRIGIGCDSLVLSRNNRELGECDGMSMFVLFGCCISNVSNPMHLTLYPVLSLRFDYI